MFRQTPDFFHSYKKIYRFLREKWDVAKVGKLRNILENFVQLNDKVSNNALSDEFWADMRVAVTAKEELNLKQPEICGILLFNAVCNNHYSISETKKDFGDETADLLNGLIKINEFSDKKSAVESENYVKLLLSIAQDIRVVFILIAQHLQRMREAKKPITPCVWNCR